MAMKKENLPAIVPELFEHESFGQFRYIKRGEELWFVAVDLCRVLGYKNTRDALARHVDAEDKNTVVIRDGIPGNPNMTVVNESGMYALIFGSQLPAAKKFKRWVTHEVLPSIRKYGFYGLLNGEQVKQLTDKQYLDYLRQLDCDQYMAYYNQLTPNQKGEHYRRLEKMLPNMTQEEIKSLANDPFIIVHRTGKGAWKVIFD